MMQQEPDEVEGFQKELAMGERLMVSGLLNLFPKLGELPGVYEDHRNYEEIAWELYVILNTTVAVKKNTFDYTCASTRGVVDSLLAVTRKSYDVFQKGYHWNKRLFDVTLHVYDQTFRTDPSLSNWKQLLSLYISWTQKEVDEFKEWHEGVQTKMGAFSDFLRGYIEKGLGE